MLNLHHLWRELQVHMPCHEMQVRFMIMSSCVNMFLLSQKTQLVHVDDNSILEDTYAKNRLSHSEYSN
jgi:hypothetical protein